MSAIFDNFERVGLRDLDQFIHFGDLVVQMHRNQGTRSRRDPLAYGLRIKTPILLAHVHKHRLSSHLHDCPSRGQPRQCRHYNFVSRTNTKSPKSDFQTDRPVGDA
jgi:hypothetical protein